MAMHPYAEGNIAAALREMRECIEALERACKARDPEAWRHIGEALGHARTVKAQLEAATELDGLEREEQTV